MIWGRCSLCFRPCSLATLDSGHVIHGSDSFIDARLRTHILILLAINWTPNLQLPTTSSSRIKVTYSTMDAHHLHSVHTIFSSAVPTILIPVSALLAIAFGVWLWWRVSFIKVGSGHHGLRTENGREYLLEEEQRGEDEVRPCARRACRDTSVGKGTS